MLYLCSWKKIRCLAERFTLAVYVHLIFWDLSKSWSPKTINWSHFKLHNEPNSELQKSGANIGIIMGPPCQTFKCQSISDGDDDLDGVDDD